MTIAAKTGPLLALAAAGLSTPAEAADWVKFYTTSSGAEAFYNAESVERSGDRARVWVRAVPPPAEAGEVSTYDGLQEMNCTARTRATLTLNVHYRDGRVQTIEGDGTVEAIEPDTTAAAIHDIVCAAPAAS